MRIKIYQVNGDLDKNRVKFMDYDFTTKHGGIDPSVYKTVFDGDVDCDSLDKIFNKFNYDRPPTFFGHSMSVSDVVEVVGGVTEQYGRIDVLYKDKNGNGQIGDTIILDNKQDFEREIEEYGLGSISATYLADRHIPMIELGSYFCDSIGFQKLDTFDSEQCSPVEGCRMLVIEPHKAPYEATIPDDYRALQQAVGGTFECTYPFDDDAFVISNDESKINGMEGNRSVNGSIYCGNMLIARDDGFGGTKDLTDEQIQKYTQMFAQDEKITPEEIEADTFIHIIGFD